jgi:hypothetical protein
MRGLSISFLNTVEHTEITQKWRAECVPGPHLRMTFCRQCPHEGKRNAISLAHVLACKEF